MGVEAETASGPDQDNAGSGYRGIDDAISAALDARDTQNLSDALKSGGDEKPAKVSEPVENEAGDDPSAEDAAVSEESRANDDSEDDGFKPLNAPKHWPEADKQAFGKLTREGQEIALKLAKNLEGGFTRKSQELSDKAKFADSIRGLFDDTARAQLQQAGLDEAGYVQYLHRLQTFATHDPVKYIQWAMQNLGVSPDQLGISQARPEGDASQPAAEKDPLADLLADPKVSQLEAQLKALQDRINQEDQARLQAQRASYANSVNSVRTHIRAFREMLDEGGQLKNPHFDAVQAHMGALMDSVPELAQMPDGPDKLQAAYDMAVWARPDLREAFIDAEAQKKIQAAQKKRDADRAKRATSVKPSAGVVSTRPKASTLDDAINQATSKLGL